MNAQRWARLSALLESAFDLDPAQRVELYARECADDPSLGEEIERWLDTQAESRGFLDPILPAVAPASAGTRVGGYTLIRRLAAGGMGVVFEAQQERPSRRVAVKLVQSALADEGTLRRFRYEAEALGRLRHPGIAQVYEAGVDTGPSGEERPFLAMEFVDGARSVTQYVRETRLAFGEVARLFIEVCAAVQHGHDRGVLHRDLKPSNVLVDAAGTAKVIDFGVARVLGDAQTRATQAGELVGTLTSMSPEQLDGDLDGLDVRTDVYALGALLYESLCGRPPIDLKGLSFADALVKARSASPASPASVRPDLPIELGWIVMRALEPERERRYPSAAELARDLERFLDDEPVQASPPSTVYRVRKFVRRNRLVVTAVAAVLVALVGGTIVSLLSRSRAVHAEGLANTRLDRLAVEARTNRELAEFQGEILTSASPDVGGRHVRVVDVLGGASAALAGRRGLDPRLELVLRRSIVEAYSALGLPKDVERELGVMRPSWEAIYAPDDPERLELERLELSNDLLLKPASACEERARAGLARAAARHGATSDEAERWQLALAAVLDERKQYAEAESLARSALAHFEKAGGPSAPDTVQARLMLVTILDALRHYDSAETLARANYEACRAAHGEDHAQTLAAKKQVAAALGQGSRPRESIPVMREIVDAHERRTGPDSPNALLARKDLANFLLRSAEPAEALSEIESALADVVAVYGDRHPFVYRMHVTRSNALVALGRPDEAIAALESALAAAHSDLGSDDPQSIELEAVLGRTLHECGRPVEALPHAQQAWEQARRVMGEDAAPTIVYGNFCGVVLGTLHRIEESTAVQEDVLQLQERRYGTDHPDTLVTLANLATACFELGDLDRGTCIASELDARVRRNPGLGPYLRGLARSAIGWGQAHLGQTTEAAASFAMAASEWSKGPDAGSDSAIFASLDDAIALEWSGRTRDGLVVLERACALATAAHISPEARGRVWATFAVMLNEVGETDRAKAMARAVLADPGGLPPQILDAVQSVADGG